MNCQTIRMQLQARGGSRSLGEVARHCRKCASCAEFADDLRLQGLLTSMPLREAGEDFEDRVLHAALVSSAKPVRQPARAPWAVAAALVVGLAVALQWSAFRNAEETRPTSMLSLSELAPLELRLDSGQALQNVKLSVDLPLELALEGYPDTQHLEWTSNLSAGSNKLVLPVQFRREVAAAMHSSQLAESIVTVTLEHEGRRKTFRIPVNASYQSSASERSAYLI